MTPLGSLFKVYSQPDLGRSLPLMRPVSRSPRLTMSRGATNPNSIQPYKDNGPTHPEHLVYPNMTISVHPARYPSGDEVPPGTWEGTKQDAVLATAQLLEVLSRKKTGEKTQFGFSEYDAQMANAQLRAFKLTKAIMRKARNSTASEGAVTIESMGFQVDVTSDSKGSDLVDTDPKQTTKPSTPPADSLQTSPKPLRRRRSTDRPKPSSPRSKKAQPASPVPPTKFPPPIPPRKSSNRNSSVPPAVTIPSRRYSDEISPKSVPLSPVTRVSRPGSPAPRNISPRRGIADRRRTPDIPEKETLPVLPYRRSKQDISGTSNASLTQRCETPIPEPTPSNVQRSNLRPSVYERIETEVTPPLMPKRGSIKRSVSFRFGEGLQNSALSRTSSLICSELSDALKDLQRTIGTATVEVH
jgi:hypothetical protein